MTYTYTYQGTYNHYLPWNIMQSIQGPRFNHPHDIRFLEVLQKLDLCPAFAYSTDHIYMYPWGTNLI